MGAMRPVYKSSGICKIPMPLFLSKPGLKGKVTKLMQNMVASKRSALAKQADLPAVVFPQPTSAAG